MNGDIDCDGDVVAEPWDAYLQRMGKPGVWCDDKMVTAASIYFKRRVVVISNAFVKPYEATPSVHLALGIRLDLEPIYLGHYSELHYVATKPLTS